MVAREVDEASVAQLRAKTVEVLTDGGIPHNSPDDFPRVTVGNDLQIWLSVRPDSGAEDETLRTLAEQIVGALAHAGLHLASISLVEHLETAERLVRGEPLRVAEAR